MMWTVTHWWQPRVGWPFLHQWFPWPLQARTQNAPSLPTVIQTEYYVSMLIRRFVSLRVACGKSYHARLTSKFASYWLHKVGGWYGILIRYTLRKHDTGFSIRPVVFVSLSCMQIIYRYIIKRYMNIKTSESVLWNWPRVQYLAWQLFETGHNLFCCSVGPRTTTMSDGLIVQHFRVKGLRAKPKTLCVPREVNSTLWINNPANDMYIETKVCCWL